MQKDIYEKFHKGMTFNKLLIDDNGNLYTNILDAEGDLFVIRFENDDCATVIVEDYMFLTLNLENLENMQILISRADTMYKKYFEFMKANKFDNKNPTIESLELFRKKYKIKSK